MSKHRRTTMGGVDGRFLTTQWTLISDSKISSEERNSIIINDLLSRYWKPVYCYLRRKGHDNESAKDLTQGFFQEIVLGRKLIRQADKAKGKFRTFLLTALDRYIIDIHRKETSAKRKPPGIIFQLDDIDLPEESLAIKDLSPEEGFDYAWVSQILDNILAEVQDECRRTSKQKHWSVFVEKVLNPTSTNTKAPSMAEICEKYGIEDENKASNMITTVKRRFRKHLELNLKQMVGSDSEKNDQISDLLNTLVGKHAG